jgi:hypothetical protein
MYERAFGAKWGNVNKSCLFSSGHSNTQRLFKFLGEKVTHCWPWCRFIVLYFISVVTLPLNIGGVKNR